ncbi:conjugative transposon protein TraN [Chitinophaga sp. Ak27]|uniref:conjugative transposon protein TraN n=1 Tax=Chitinophaga sp. Ak27 TaxID=2726116 RepID=UPI00145FA370|nr:conjugative transposon protein TraN [Chitinophaga sp. Ak27]NLU91375.1 conjugative transposon protein TraN [Chitinophaga sp. Ak27]
MKVLLVVMILFAGFYNAEAQVPPYPQAIQVGSNTTTMLVFPAAIKDADRGSADIIIQPVKNARNVLKVKAVKENFQQTNLTVFTEDDKVYSVSVSYHPSPFELAYNFTQVPLNLPPATERPLNDPEVQAQSELIAGLAPITRHPTQRAYAMEMRLNGIYSKGGVLFFQFSLSNHSNIPFSLAFLRAYHRDKTKAKRSSRMEKEVLPRYFAQHPTVAAHTTANFVVAMDQFTIADNKLFVMECFEKNGDRHLALKIKGKHILRAHPLR